MATELATTTYNKHVLVIYSKCNRYMEEFHLSNSANAAAMDKNDVKRCKLYINDIRGYLKVIQDPPLPDLVETAPKVRNLVAPYVIIPIENEAVMEFCFYLEDLRDELANSQSARQHSGLLYFDYDMAVDLLEIAEKFLTEYAEKLMPIPRPKTSPKYAMAPAGAVGVNP